MNDEESVLVYTVRSDVTDFCNGVPEGFRVVEKSLTDGAKTYCCSMTPSLWVDHLRYDLEPIDEDMEITEEISEVLLEYEDKLTEEMEVFGCYYDWHSTEKIEDGVYETIEDAMEFHHGNHIF